MNIARQRALNIVGGLMSFILGLGFCAAALYIVRMPPAAKRAPYEAAAHVSSCVNALHSLGFDTQRFATEIRAKRPVLAQPQTLLSQASLGIALCHLPLLRFCMGTGCHAPALPNGISFALATQTASSASPR